MCLFRPSLSLDQLGFPSFSVEKDGSKCRFPDWMGRHHDWLSVEEGTRIHVNRKGHSLKMRNGTGGQQQQQQQQQQRQRQDAHATCHQVEQVSPGVARVVAHVRAGW